MKSDELIGLFDQFDARQILHITYSSVLNDYGARLKDFLNANPILYEDYLEVRFGRHLELLIEDRD